MEIDEKLVRLGKKRLALAIHDASFPSDADEEIGRGSPYDRGARTFLEQVRSLGFNAIQLGPQGQTTHDNPSPYDATVFSRSWSSIALMPLVEEGLLSREKLEAPRSLDRSKVDHAHAFRVKRAALESIPISSFAGQLAEYRKEHRLWIEPDGRYDALESIHGTRHWLDWPAPAQRFVETEDQDPSIDRWALWQLIAERQHAELRETCRRLGLALFGDLQVGWSPRDLWRWRELFLEDWLMGAPPSRTNPEGQPWGYAVLDPEQYSDGLRLLTARIDRMTSFYDGIRIDHPHGLVCPWIYRDDVAKGARLLCSPDLPELGRYAIARPEQLDRGRARWADEWVRSLDPEQVDRHAILFDAVVERAGLVICEVLSTQPLPLQRVLARHGLGRFRVTQKADLDDASDVYRSENARPEDWIMVGTHDTQPIWLLAREWQASGEAKRQAAYLARRLRPRSSSAEQDRFAAELAADRRELVHAKFADIFASNAENVMIFFSDLYGLEALYNRPGVIHEDNWTLRVPPHHPPALDLDRVLDLALEARVI